MTTNWSPQKQLFKSRSYTCTDASCQYNKGHGPGRPRAHHVDCSFRWSDWKAYPNSGNTYKCVFNTCANTCHWRDRPRWRVGKSQRTCPGHDPSLLATLGWIYMTQRASSLQTRCGGWDARPMIGPVLTQRSWQRPKQFWSMIVKFSTPQSHKVSTMQMSCTILEPKRGLGQGSDLSVFTAINYTLPQARALYNTDDWSLFHVYHRHHKSNAGWFDWTAWKRGLYLTHKSTSLTMRHQSEILLERHNFRSERDPLDYAKAAPDPKHHGQAMRSPMRAEWIKSQGFEMQGLWKPGVFHKVLRTSLTSGENNRIIGRPKVN